MVKKGPSSIKKSAEMIKGDQEIKKKTKTERIDLPIVGMSCAGCAATVQKNLADLKGVDSANVNFATTQATVLFQPQLVDPADLISRVRKSGYDVGTASVEIPIQGMHCASCVQAIEKALLQEKGITKASVNLASEKAKIDYIPSLISLPEIKKVIEQTGYKVLKLPEEGELEDLESKIREKEYRKLRTKFFVGTILGLIIFFGSMPHWFPWIPSFLNNFFVLWILATPVQFWIGRQFYRGAWSAFRHRNADMNTLIAVGTSAAYLYSVAATVFPSFFESGGINPDVYFDTSAMIIVLILFGRLLEARAKGHTSDAIKKLIGLQPKTARVKRGKQDKDIGSGSDHQTCPGCPGFQSSDPAVGGCDRQLFCACRDFHCHCDLCDLVQLRSHACIDLFPVEFCGRDDRGLSVRLGFGDPDSRDGRDRKRGGKRYPDKGRGKSGDGS